MTTPADIFAAVGDKVSLLSLATMKKVNLKTKVNVADMSCWEPAEYEFAYALYWGIKVQEDPGYTYEQALEVPAREVQTFLGFHELMTSLMSSAAAQEAMQTVSTTTPSKTSKTATK